MMLLLAAGAAVPVSGADSFQQSLYPLIIRSSGDREIIYGIELADTDAARRRGLMFRKSMPADQGMLLDFRAERRVGIWMKNTYIPLDLLFINNAGKIIHLHHGAEPLSTTTITGGNRVRAVLEINAGEIEQHGISVGDRVIFPSFAADE